MPPWLRSTLSVIAAFLLWVVLLALFGGLSSKFLHVHADRPDTGFFVVSLAYGFLSALLAGYFVVWLGGRHPVSHGVGLTMVLLVWAFLNVWMKAESVHGWYVLLWNLGCPFAAILGSFLRRVQCERNLAKCA